MATPRTNLVAREPLADQQECTDVLPIRATAHETSERRYLARGFAVNEVRFLGAWIPIGGLDVLDRRAVQGILRRPARVAHLSVVFVVPRRGPPIDLRDRAQESFVELLGHGLPVLVARRQDRVERSPRTRDIRLPCPDLAQERAVDLGQLADDRRGILAPLDLERRDPERDVPGHILEELVDLVV